jgi:hypothetical protein
MDAVRLLAVLDQPSVPAWQLEAIAALEQTGYAEVEVRSVPRSGRTERPPALFRAYEAWEQRRFSDAGAILAGRAHRSPQLRDSDWDGVHAALWLSDQPLPERALALPRGAWLIRQGRMRTPSQVPVFRELCAGKGLVETALYERTAAGERLLLRSKGPVDPVSLLRTRARAYVKAAQLPARYICRQAEGRDDDHPVRPAPPDPASPGTALTAVDLARLGRRMARRRLRARLLESEWFVAYRPVSGPEDRLRPSASFVPLFPPSGHFYADPFLLHHEGDALIFEDYLRAEDRGVIAQVELGANGPVGEPRRTFEIDSHLSYPFVFQRDDETLMIPESRHERRVQLLRAANGQPGSWEPVRTLIDDIGLTDSTLLFHDDRVWLFGTLALDDGPALDELHLFSAPSLQGEWTPHPLNPVVSDVRSARPAGALFTRAGELIRPSQDCSRSYGWRVVLNRVDVLTGDDYRETPIGHIEPDQRGISRTHTYNASSRYETVDGLRLVPRLAVLRRRPRSVRFKVKLYEDGGDARRD